MTVKVLSVPNMNIMLHDDDELFDKEHKTE